MAIFNWGTTEKEKPAPTSGGIFNWETTQPKINSVQQAVDKLPDKLPEAPEKDRTKIGSFFHNLFTKDTTPEVKSAVESLPEPTKSFKEKYLNFSDKLARNVAQPIGVGLGRTLGSTFGALETVGRAVLNPVGKLIDNIMNIEHKSYFDEKTGGEQFSDFISKADEITRNITGDEKKYIDNVLEGVGSSGVFLIGGEAGVAAKLPKFILNIGLSGTEAMINAFDDYTDLKNSGAKNAPARALASFGANLGINYISNKLGFLGEAKEGAKGVLNVVKRFLISTGLELAQEDLQQLTSDVVKGTPLPQALKNIAQTTLVTLPVAGLFGVAGVINVHESINVKKKANQFIDEMADEGATKEDIANVVQAVTDVPIETINQNMDQLLANNEELSGKIAENESTAPKKTELEDLARNLPKEEANLPKEGLDLTTPKEVFNFVKKNVNKLTSNESVTIQHTDGREITGKPVFKNNKVGILTEDKTFVPVRNIKAISSEIQTKDTGMLFRMGATDKTFRNTLTDEQNNMAAEYFSIGEEMANGKVTPEIGRKMIDELRSKYEASLSPDQKSMVDTLITKSDNKTYGKGSNGKRGSSIVPRTGEEVRGPGDGRGQNVESNIHVRQMAKQWLSDNDKRYADDTHEPLRRQVSDLGSGRSVEITKDTPDILREVFGFSEQLTTKLTDVHNKGLVPNIVIAEKYEGETFEGGYNPENQSLYLNPGQTANPIYQNGNIITHEISGHAWFFAQTKTQKLNFIDALKNTKETVKKAWEGSNNPHVFYWTRTLKDLHQSIQRSTRNQGITDQIIKEFGLEFNDNISLDDFIEESLNLDRKMEAINAEIFRRGGSGLDMDITEMSAINEHVAMIAENSAKLTSTDETIQKYIEDVQDNTLTSPEDNLTLDTLEKLKGRRVVSKQFISDLTNRGEIKQVERDLIRAALETEGDKVNVKDFIDKVKIDLLPLTVESEALGGDAGTLYEHVSLPENLRGNVKDYSEKIYGSPVKTSAASIHFNGMVDNYFGHTRIEDMAPNDSDIAKVNHIEEARRKNRRMEGEKQVGRRNPEDTKRIDRELSEAKKRIEYSATTRRVIEVQSDLYQKGELANKIPLEGNGGIRAGDKPLQKLQQYNDPTSHFRMVREEIRQAAKDGKTKLQFPTGETAMKIEGLGQNSEWIGTKEDGTNFNVRPDDLKVGMEVSERRGNDNWVVTNVLGDGKFKAVPERYYEDFIDGDTQLVDIEETFDVSGKVDTTNPIYRFYEKDLGRYLKNNYDAKPITDDKGVTWYEMHVDKKLAKEPVFAFRKGDDIDNLRRQLDRVEQSLAGAEENPDAHEKAYGRDKRQEYKDKIESLKERIKIAKKEGAKQALENTEHKFGVEPFDLEEFKISNDEQNAINEEYNDVLKEADQQLADEVRAIREVNNDAEANVEIENLKLQREFMKDTMALNPAKKLSKYANKRTMELPEVTGKPTSKFAKFGDEIADELGYKSSEEAREAYQGYLKRKEQYLETKNYISERVKNFREKKQIIEAVEKQIRAEGRDRMRQVNIIKDFFKLTDAEMKKIMKGNPDLRLISDEKFKDLLKGIEGKAYEVMRHNEAMMAIENTIFEKELKKVENLRQALKMREFKNMSVGELEKFNNLLQTYQKGDEFLGPRQIQTATLTDLGPVKTRREALAHLAKEAKAPMSDVMAVQVKPMDRFLYDVPFAKKNPLYKVMVDNVNRAQVESGLKYTERQDEINKLFKAARASRRFKIGQKLVPIDEMIFDYLSNDDATKIEIAKTMTPAEIRAALYVQNVYLNMRDSLLNQGALEKYRINYVTHIRRSFLEALKDTGKGILTKEGIKGLVGELFDVHKYQRANFNILNDKTGEVLPLEKFFKFSMERTGTLIPTKNVAKAFLAYYKTFLVKQQLDSFIPKLDIFAHILTPQQTTKRGLLKNDTLRIFIRKWLNTKKGRVIDTGIISPGDFFDVTARAGIALTRLIDLGLNIPVGLASNLGAQTATFIPLGTKDYAKGVARSMTNKGRKIANKYEALVGERLGKKLTDASKDIGDKSSEVLFGLFSIADRKAKTVFLLGKMTAEEYKSGEMSKERLAELRNEMGRYHVMSGMESIIGKTAFGAVFKQYKSWAIPLMHSTIENIQSTIKSVKGKTNPMKTKEGQELFRTILIPAILLLIGFKTYNELKNKKGRSFLENLAFKSMNDALSIMGSLDPATWASTPRLVSFLNDLSTSLSNVATALVTGTRTNTGKIPDLSKLKATVTPKILKQFSAGMTTSPLDTAVHEESAIQAEAYSKADEDFKKINKLKTNKEKKDYLIKLAEEDPKNAKKVLDMITEKAKGITADDKRIKALGVEDGTRAGYIYKELNKLKTNKEKRDYLIELADKKILSKEVMTQVLELIKQ